jgi:C1A family cysteine protease
MRSNPTDRSTSTPIIRFGTHPDVPDRRDAEYLVPPRHRHSLPTRVSLRRHCPPVFNQGTTLNSCSAHAIASALWFLERRRNPNAPAPSRLFLYYNERARERLTGTNAPVSLRAGYRTVAQQGICDEAMWPYRDDQFAVAPPAACYRAARKHRAIQYFRLQRQLGDFRGCLASGYPFTMGISVYESFISKAVAVSGQVSLPYPHERHLGGHAMLVVGYDDKTHQFVVRNSAGPRWGKRGYGLMPYAYLLDETLAWDFWMVRRQGR